MEPSEFIACRGRLGLSQDGLAQVLDMSKRQIQYYESGAWPIPRVVELALKTLERQKIASSGD